MCRSKYLCMQASLNRNTSAAIEQLPGPQVWLYCLAISLDIHLSCASQLESGPASECAKEGAGSVCASVSIRCVGESKSATAAFSIDGSGHCVVWLGRTRGHSQSPCTQAGFFEGKTTHDDTQEDTLW